MPRRRRGTGRTGRTREDQSATKIPNYEDLRGKLDGLLQIEEDQLYYNAVVRKFNQSEGLESDAVAPTLSVIVCEHAPDTQFSDEFFKAAELLSAVFFDNKKTAGSGERESLARLCNATRDAAIDTKHSQAWMQTLQEIAFCAKAKVTNDERVFNDDELRSLTGSASPGSDTDNDAMVPSRLASIFGSHEKLLADQFEVLSKEGQKKMTIDSLSMWSQHPPNYVTIILAKDLPLSVQDKYVFLPVNLDSTSGGSSKGLNTIWQLTDSTQGWKLNLKGELEDVLDSDDSFEKKYETILKKLQSCFPQGCFVLAPLAIREHQPSSLAWERLEGIPLAKDCQPRSSAAATILTNLVGYNKKTSMLARVVSPLTLLGVQSLAVSGGSVPSYIAAPVMSFIGVNGLLQLLAAWEKCSALPFNILRNSISVLTTTALYAGYILALRCGDGSLNPKVWGENGGLYLQIAAALMLTNHLIDIARSNRMGVVLCGKSFQLGYRVTKLINHSALIAAAFVSTWALQNAIEISVSEWGNTGIAAILSMIVSTGVPALMAAAYAIMVSIQACRATDLPCYIKAIVIPVLSALAFGAAGIAAWNGYNVMTMLDPGGANGTDANGSDTVFSAAKRFNGTNITVAMPLLGCKPSDEEVNSKLMVPYFAGLAVSGVAVFGAAVAGQLVVKGPCGPKVRSDEASNSY